MQMKRFTAMVLAVLMTLSILPTNILADSSSGWETGYGSLTTSDDDGDDTVSTDAGKTIESGGSATLVIGETITLQASTDTTKTYSWSVTGDTAAIELNPSSGTVTSVVATAKSVGTAIVTATRTKDSGGISTKTFTVNVKEPLTLSLDRSEGTISAGNTATLTATVSPAASTVTWASSDTSVVTVSDSGEVTAVKSGTAVITATAANSDTLPTQKTASCTVTVEEGLSLSLDKTVASVAEEGTVTLIATADPTDGTTVTWTSSDTSVATVSDSGEVTAVKSGTAVITATAANSDTLPTQRTASCTVTVEEGLSLSLDKTVASVAEEGTVTLIATADPTEGTTVTWTSSDTSVATVDGGVVTGIKKGSAVITVTATNGNFTASKACSVTVTPKPITLTPKGMTLVVGETGKITASDKATFTSLSSSVATVDANGTVTAVSEGTAIIQATAENGTTAYCAVVVEAYSITAEPQTLEVAVGGTENDAPAIVAEDGYSVEAVSSDTDIATVTWANGNAAVTGVKEGNATVTLTLKDKSGEVRATDTFTVTVVPAEKTYITVIFMDDTGAVLSTKLIESGTAVQMPLVTAPEGYTFTGWGYQTMKYSEGQNVTLPLDINPDETVYEFRQTFAQKKYTVKFETAYGTTPADQQIALGRAATRPTDFYEKGDETDCQADGKYYRFLGWYYGDEEWNFSEAVTSDMTLTAKWAVVQVTIYFYTAVGIKAEYTIDKGSDWSGTTPVIASDYTVEPGLTDGPGDLTYVGEDGFYAINDQGTTLSHKWCYFRGWLAPGSDTTELNGGDAITLTNVTENIVYNALYEPKNATGVSGQTNHGTKSYIRINVYDALTGKKVAAETRAFTVTPQFGDTTLIEEYTGYDTEKVTSDTAKFAKVDVASQLGDSITIDGQTFAIDYTDGVTTTNVNAVWLCKGGRRHVYGGTSECGGGSWIPTSDINIYGKLQADDDAALLVVNYYLNDELLETVEETLAVAAPMSAAGYIAKYTDQYAFENLEWVTGSEQLKAVGGTNYELSIYYKSGPYDLTIHYVDEDGNTLHDDFVQADFYYKNNRYVVVSPTIDGYELVNSAQSTVKGTFSNSDIEITVTYKVANASYTVNYYLLGTDVKVADSVEGEAVIGSTVTVATPKFYKEYAAAVKDSGADSFTVVKGGNTVNLYYKVPLTVTAESDTKVYDGTALTNSEIKSVNGLVNGDTADKFAATMTAGSTITNVGSVDNVIDTLTYNGTSVPGYYTVTKANGTLTVTKASMTVTVTGNTGSKEYTGASQSVTGYTATSTSDLFSATDVVLKDTATDTATGKNVGTYNMGLTEDSFSYANDNIDVTFVVTDGSLTVTKADLTVTADSASKTYDGTALTKNSYTATATKGTDAITSVTVEGSITEAGSVANVASAAKVMNGTEDVTGNYNITYVDGTLTVNNAAITVNVKAEDVVAPYDGEEHTATNVTFSSTSSLFDEELVSYTAKDVTSTNAIVKTNIGYTAEDFSYGNSNVNVTFVVEDGSLTVNKAALTITADSAEKVYDGTALTEDSYTATSTKGGDSVTSVTVTGSITDVGTAANVASEAVIKNAKGEDVTSNYAITYKDGELEVTKKAMAVTVTGNMASVVYNAEEQSVTGYTVSSTDAKYDASKVTFSGNATANGTDAGTYSMGLTAEQFGYNDNNYNVTFTVTDGSLAITKAPLTITADSATKTYDSTALTDSGYEDVAPVGLKGDDAIASVEVAGSQTNVGSSANNASAAVVKNGDKDVTDNYAITYNPGTLTVTKKAITVTVTGNSGSVVYNGTEQSKTGYMLDCTDGLYDASKVTFSGNDTAKGTDVGTYTMGLNKDQFGYDDGNFDVTFNVTDGSLTVTPKEVTVTVDDKTKTYGEDDPELTAKVDGLVDGEGEELISYTVTREEGEDAGKHTVTASGDKEQGNYIVTYKPGTLTIDKAEMVINVIGEQVTATYDGKNHVATGVTFEMTEGNKALYSADKIVYTAKTSESVNVVTEQAIGYAASDFSYSDKNIDVTFNVTDGWLTVEPKQVTVKANDATKTYGEDDPELTAKVDGMVEGEDPEKLITYTVTREDGENAGKHTVTASGEKNQGNYVVTYEPGDLTIEKRNITVEVTGNSGSVVYNGTEQSKTGYMLDCADGLYDASKVTFTGNDTAKGTDVGTYTMGLNKDQFGYDDGNFDVTFNVTDGKLTVTPKEVTVTVEDKTKIYGDDDPELTAKVDGLVDGESEELITYTVTREEGEDAGKHTVTASGDKEQGNYVVTYEPGTLTVEKAKMTVTVTGEQVTATYDGKNHVATDVTFEMEEGNEKLYSADKIGYTVKTSESVNVVTEQAIGYAASDFSYSDENIDVIFNVTDGWLTVEPKHITVKGDDITKTYGEDDPELTVTVDGMVDGEDPKELIDYTVTREDGDTVGDYTVTVDGDKEQGNYVVTYEPGNLTIEKAKITVTVTGEQVTATYDGQNHVATEVTFKQTAGNEKLYDADKISYTAKTSESINAVKEQPIGYTSEDFSYDDENLIVTFEVDDGYLTIEPKQIVVKADDITKDYGEDDPELTVTVEGMVEGEDPDELISYTVTRDDSEEPGEHIITVTGDEEQGNYIVTYEPGSFTIRPVVIIHYWYETVGGEQAAEDFTRAYDDGEEYYIVSPDIYGWTANQTVVSGTVTGGNVLVDVVYTRNTHNITVNYVYRDGKTAAPSVETTLYTGESYSFESPTIKDYFTTTPVVEGVMPDTDVIITVIYIRQHKSVYIEESEVALGVGTAVVVNIGDCIE